MSKVKRFRRCLVSLVFYVLQSVCIVACAGNPPAYGVGWALAAFVVGLGSTLTIATLGPPRGFMWVMNPFED